MGRVLESVASRLSSTRVCWFSDNQNVTAAVILNPTDMVKASILDRNIALTSSQHASESVIQEKVVQAR